MEGVMVGQEKGGNISLHEWELDIVFGEHYHLMV
jgi:hypothetical protein